jgi:hypothetical protein
MPNLEPGPKAREGARKVLIDSLGLSTNERLTVFFDETTEPVANVIIQEAKALRIRVTKRFVPVQRQRVYSKTSHPWLAGPQRGDPGATMRC